MECDAKVEQYMVLAKHCTGAQLAELIVRAISESGLFVFSEFIALPGVSSLQSTHAATVATLELFAYGTWEDYVANRAAFLALDEPQAKKLKQLSICSFAQTQKTLSYDMLIQKLELGSVRELEDFIIKDCIYPSLLKCTLDQRQRCVHVSDVWPRDVRPEQLPLMIRQLEAWLGQISGVVAAMKGNVDALEHAHVSARAGEDAYQKEVARVVATLEKSTELTAQDAMSGADSAFEHGAEAPGVPSLRSARGLRLPGGRGGPDAKRRR